jgi:ATP-binding cassette subfamily B protein
MKKRKRQNYIFRTFGIFGEYKWKMLIVILVGIIGIVSYSLMPTYLQFAFTGLEEGIPNPDIGYILQMLGIFFGLLLVNEIFYVICIFLMLDYEARGTQKLGVLVKRKFDVVPTAALERYTASDLSRMVAYNAPDMMKNSLVTLFQISRSVFFCITTGIAMLAINWILMLVVLSSLPLCILTARFVSKRTQKYFNSQNLLNGELSTYVDQRISLLGLYQAHGLDENIADFNKKNQAHSRSLTGEITCTALNTMYIAFIKNFMLVLITVLCCILYNNALLAFAALPTFIMFSQRFLDQSVVVTDATNVLQVLSARAARIFGMLDQPEVTEHECRTVSKLQGDIKFKNVTLVEQGEKLINNLNLTIPQGASIGITGPSGGGKHKLVELLAKLAVPTEGTVTIGGVDLRELNSASYYDRISIAFEKPFIFKGTVADNILYGVGRTLPEKVMNTARKLKSHYFIEQLPQGYDTEVSEKTGLLSASQKQAINVARSVLENPDILIMDSALSFADNIIEREVFAEIMKTGKHQTKIFVTHRLGSIQNCDLIIYMENGRIVEMGSHRQLMDKKKKYYNAFVGGM